MVEKLGTYDELKKKIDEKYTSHQIITTLKEMYVLEKLEQGHIPLYTRTDLTDIYMINSSLEPITRV